MSSWIPKRVIKSQIYNDYKITSSFDRFIDNSNKINNSNLNNNIITVPSVTVPSVTVPSVTVPSVTVPSVTVPSVTMPSVTVPSVTMPSVTVPSVNVQFDNIPVDINNVSHKFEVNDINKIIQNNLLYPDIEILQIYIISDIRGGGTLKYINDIIKQFSGKYIDFININTIEQFNAINNQKSIIFIQSLINTNIYPKDIISKKQLLNNKLIFVIHDFTIFSHNYFEQIRSWDSFNQSVHSSYLSNNNKYLDDNLQFLKICDTVICPSIFTKNEITKRFNLNNIEIVNHIDYVSNIVNNTYNIPVIKNNIINIAIPSYISECKGEEYYEYIINTFSSHYSNKQYTINYILFISKNNTILYNKFNKPNTIILEPYNENELYDILKKYNVHLLLYLNKWGETYSYCLSKGLNTNLPIIYTNIGSYKERIQDRPHYFKIDVDDNKLPQIINILPEFYNALNFIIKNNNTLDNSAELYMHIPNFYYNLFTEHIYNYFKKMYNTNSKFYESISNIVEAYAIYFPQFHEIPENNITYYKGYSDMINLEKFKNNNNNIQTPISTILGYYNLKYNKYIIDSEILIAKSYGFKGFALYYYWFSKNTITNKNKIFEDIINRFFNNNLDNFDIFFIYANESWSNNTAFNSNTQDNKHIIINIYNEENINKLTNELIVYFKHNNYRKIDNKPVFLLHHPWELSTNELDLMYTIMNNSCKNAGFDGIHFILNSIDGKQYTYDTYYIHPDYKNSKNIAVTHTTHPVLDYEKYINNLNTTNNENNSIIKSCFTNFNNCVRLLYNKNGINNYTSISNYNINLFKTFIQKQIQFYKHNANNNPTHLKIMLFNAWNEWGEQMIISPSNELGFLYLNIIKNNLLNLVIDLD